MLECLFALVCCAFADPTSEPMSDQTRGDGPGVTRSVVILTAYPYVRIHWSMTEVNQTGTTCSEGFLSQYSEGDRIGMGYKWGAWDTVEEFLRKIVEGHGTGTGPSVSYEEYDFECVTGISCTGLVSRAWLLENKYTLTYPGHPEIPRQMHEITYDIQSADFLLGKTGSLRKGDAFMNSYHIILFIYETRDGDPMVIDSRLDGVSLRKTSWTTLALEGYKAIRYNRITDIDNPLGTTANPIIIDSNDLPFFHKGNTLDVVSMFFDSYPCDTATNEQGPEVIYRLDFAETGVVKVKVTQDKNAGVDNEVYLLKTLRSDGEYRALDCIGSTDSVLTVVLNQGPYYLVVDSGEDKPGEYALAVNRVDEME